MLAAAAFMTLGCHQAAAAWLQCAASATSADHDRGLLGFYTTITDVGATPPARIATLQERLQAYVQRYEAGLSDARARCYSFADQVEAASFYSRALDSAYRRLGWAHVIVVQPSDWLPPGDIVSDPLLP
jgi:hypothetical protein